MRRAEVFVLGVSLAVAGFAIWSLIDGGMAEGPSSPALDTAAVEAAPPALPEVVELVGAVPPPPSVEALPAAISTVLAANGHTEMLARADLERELAPSIVAVLIANDVVLRLADSGTGGEGP